jgi:hypothetical protein
LIYEKSQSTIKLITSPFTRGGLKTFEKKSHDACTAFDKSCAATGLLMPGTQDRAIFPIPALLWKIGNGGTAVYFE